MSTKGTIHVVHLYPREMSIYGDLGNTRVLMRRIARHGYTPILHEHHPGADFPATAHVIMGGGGQDSGQLRVEEDLAAIGDRLRDLAAQDVPMLMVCGMYQLMGKRFVTSTGSSMEGLGILDVTTTGGAQRLIGPVALQTPFGQVVGYENHSGVTELGASQQPFGTVVSGHGNGPEAGHEGARAREVIGTYLHGPILPANPALADSLIAAAARFATGDDFQPGLVDDSIATQAHDRQWRRILAAQTPR